MTGEEIVNALRCCASVDGTGCAKCSNEELNNDELLPCADVLKSAAADLIENQQRHIEALLQANDALRERQRWIPVQERLPEDPIKKCIVFAPHTHGNIVASGRYLGSDGWVLEGWDLTQTAVTHWMPFPEAPEED